jgi:hypothetical protein
MSIETDRNNFTASRGSAEIETSLSNVDEDAIRTLATELRAPIGRVAEIYRRELARLAPRARVKAFLPLVIGRLVRRRRVEEGWSTA